MTAATLSWLTRNGRLRRGRNCILVTWYTKDGKCQYFLGVTFMFLPWTVHCNFLWSCSGGNNILCQLLKTRRLFPSPNLGWACVTVYPHSGAFWSTGGLGTTLSIWKWRPNWVSIRTLFGLLVFYLKRALQRKMCHKCIFLWHTCLFHKDVANRTFSTRVLQTVSLVSRLDSRILIWLGALQYVTGVLLRRWAWLILSNPVTSSRIRPLSIGHCTRRLHWIWVRWQNCGCLVTWFCYQLIAKLVNKTAAVPSPDPYKVHSRNYVHHSSLVMFRLDGVSADIIHILQG